jgi:hypothetical protein
VRRTQKEAARHDNAVNTSEVAQTDEPDETVFWACAGRRKRKRIIEEEEEVVAPCRDETQVLETQKSAEKPVDTQETWAPSGKSRGVPEDDAIGGKSRGVPEDGAFGGKSRGVPEDGAKGAGDAGDSGDSGDRTCGKRDQDVTRPQRDTGQHGRRSPGSSDGDGDEQQADNDDEGASDSGKREDRPGQAGSSALEKKKKPQKLPGCCAKCGCSGAYAWHPGVNDDDHECLYCQRCFEYHANNAHVAKKVHSVKF